MAEESSDLYSYCKICRFNHTQKRKHIFTKKHKQILKGILKKFGSKLKLCRPYLDNPVIQEGEFESDGVFWCHCCSGSFNKHVTDKLKTILYGGVFEHLASDEHINATEIFWCSNGADKKFKHSFIISKTDFHLYKEKLVPLVDKFNDKKDEKTTELANNIKSQESSRFFANFEDNSFRTPKKIYRTVKNSFGILQNPTGYHDDVRVWKGGVVKYRDNSDQIIPFTFEKKLKNKTYSMSNDFLCTLSAEGEGLSKVSVIVDADKGNIHSGATPPWLVSDNSTNQTEMVQIGPSEDDFLKHLKMKEKTKLNPKRVGANFDHSINTETDWFPSFGRVWNQGARWKSRKEYHSEIVSTSKKFKKSE